MAHVEGRACTQQIHGTCHFSGRLGFREFDGMTPPPLFMAGQCTLNLPPYPKETTLYLLPTIPCFLNENSYHSLISRVIASAKTAI